MKVDFGAIASSGVLAGMESNSVAQRTAAALRGKIIHTHTDIRVDSVEDETSSRVDDNVESFDGGLEERERAVRSQAWWDAAIQKHMGLNGGYENAAVLLVRWHDELDDLKTRAEVISFSLLEFLPSLSLLPPHHLQFNSI